MKKILATAFLALAILSCSQTENNLEIAGEISGLKKGTLYLQKIEDTMLVNLDSVIVNGDPSFSFELNLEEPQMLYLFLDKTNSDTFEDRLGIFAEQGEIKVNTSLEKFGLDARVEGSANQKKLEEYKDIIRKFNNQSLDLIEKGLEAQKTANDSVLTKTNEAIQNLNKRKYLYTVNFAINNKDKEIAPFLILSEAYNANIKFLDTVYNSLHSNVQQSLYGKKLEDLIKERKALETNITE